jgi:hypothetical protein
MTALAEVQWRRTELVRRTRQLDSVAEVFAEASPRLRRLVPFDASAWVATDPATGLPIAPTRIENVDDAAPDHCLAYWRREFLDLDVNLFRDIATARVPAAALCASVADPRRSARYREFVEPLGLGDELRAMLRVGGNSWAWVCLWRHAGQPPSRSTR